MYKCKKCQGTKMKMRTNYSHGNKSRSITSITCKNCGSMDVESQQVKRRNYRRK